MREWDAEIVVEADLAARLITEQFPQLAVGSLEPMLAGWDNTTWLVDHQLVFRFPRRAMAIPGVEREIAILPELAPRLPLAVPLRTFLGHATDAYPWPFFGSPLVAGRDVADAELTEAARADLAAPLGRFLRALHAPALLDEFGARLPVDPNRRADMTVRVPMTRGRLAELERSRFWQSPALPWLDAADELPPSQAMAVTHGDLHVRHLLVDGGERLSGVIDWGDIGRSDPAIDLPAYWSVLPPAARPAFLAAYGPVSEAALLRARVLAVFLSATLVLYAHAEGMAALERESLAGLQRSLG